MSEVSVVYDLSDPKTGRTYREGNLAREHRIPIGTLVEVQFDGWFGGGACWKVHARLWVTKHYRDCDGSPLYRLSRYRDPDVDLLSTSHGGFAEDALFVVIVTPELIGGHGALEWKRAPFGRDANNADWWPRFKDQLMRLDVPSRIWGTLARAGDPTAWGWGERKSPRLPNEIFIDDRGYGIGFIEWADRALDPAWRERFLSVRQFGVGSYEQLQEAARLWKDGCLEL